MVHSIRNTVLMKKARASKQQVFYVTQPLNKRNAESETICSTVVWNTTQSISLAAAHFSANYDLYAQIFQFSNHMIGVFTILRLSPRLQNPDRIGKAVHHCFYKTGR